MYTVVVLLANVTITIATLKLVSLAIGNYKRKKDTKRIMDWIYYSLLNCQPKMPEYRLNKYIQDWMKNDIGLWRLLGTKQKISDSDREHFYSEVNKIGMYLKIFEDQNSVNLCYGLRKGAKEYPFQAWAEFRDHKTQKRWVLTFDEYSCTNVIPLKKFHKSRPKFVHRSQVYLGKI